jgi:hypothetical protein
MASGSTQLLTEMSMRNLPRGKAWLARNLTTSPPSVTPLIRKMWGPQRLTALWASMACYRDGYLLLKLQDRQSAYAKDTKLSCLAECGADLSPSPLNRKCSVLSGGPCTAHPDTIHTPSPHITPNLTPAKPTFPLTVT